MGLWGRVKSVARKIYHKVKKKAKEIYEDVKEDVQEAAHEIADTWKETWQNIKACTGGLGCLTAVVGGVVKGVLVTAGSIVDLAFDAVGWCVDVVFGVLGTVVGGVIALIGALLPGSVGRALENFGFWVLDGAYTIGRYISDFFDALGGFLQRLIRSLFSLILLALVLLRLLYCSVVLPAISHGRSAPNSASDLSNHSMRTLEVEVIIIDNDAELNPITESELSSRVNDADRILGQRAHIRVKKHGPIKRSVSSALYHIDASGPAGQLSEWLKGPLQLLGRDNPRHLTVYAVGSISGTDESSTEGVHQPLYGSVFISRGKDEATLAHEIGHALLSIDRMGHRADSMNLMYPSVVSVRNPTLTEDQWCSMRQSRWLNWSWECDRCVAVGR